MLSTEVTLPDSIQRWIVKPICDQPWSAYHTKVTAEQYFSWVHEFATAYDSAFTNFSCAASSDRSSEYIISIPDEDHEDAILEEYHDGFARNPERFRHIKRALDDWKSVNWPATYDQYWVFPNGSCTADATADRLSRWARDQAARKRKPQQGLVIHPLTESTCTPSQVVNHLETEDETSVHTNATSFMPDIGAAAVSPHRKPKVSRSSHYLLVAEPIKLENMAKPCVEKCSGKYSQPGLELVSDQPGRKPVNDQPKIQVAGSVRSANWYPKLPGSPVRDFLIQVQKQEDTIHTVIVSNQDDGLIPIISENNLLPKVTFEAGTSLHRAKKIIRVYPVKRSIMSIMLFIALSIFVLSSLLALLFRLLQDLSATEKASISILIQFSSVVVATRLYSYYTGKHFECPKEFHQICQLIIVSLKK
ncbi:hypothetical protein MMC17_003906 [Xylographa soralifera]|nr:hypothetical protein [Xylographa soralifera]